MLIFKYFHVPVVFVYFCMAFVPVKVLYARSPDFFVGVSGACDICHCSYMQRPTGSKLRPWM